MLLVIKLWVMSGTSIEYSGLCSYNAIKRLDLMSIRTNSFLLWSLKSLEAFIFYSKIYIRIHR